MSIYKYHALDIEGNPISLSDFQGKVLLIVNTASLCDYSSQLRDLEDLYQKYRDRGFLVLGFPCNQFSAQEPGEDLEIMEFCKMRYGITFPLFSKIDVNGKNAHPLFIFLKKARGGMITRSIKWNFTKFLVGREGEVFKRYSTLSSIKSIESDLEKLLE